MEPVKGYDSETQRTLTPRQRAANWWAYHKLQLGIAAAVLLLLLFFVLQDRAIPAPDYTVGWVSARELDGPAAERLSRRLAGYGRDLNGDGQVYVELHQITLDLRAVLERGAQGQNELGELMALEADLDVGQSGIFITDDPAAFQAQTGALLYRDGSLPVAGAQDWERMVISWEEEGLGPVYAGLRGCWKEDWQETWALYQELWAGLAAAAA